jgi:hypothetical protein
MSVQSMVNLPVSEDLTRGITTELVSGVDHGPHSPLSFDIDLLPSDFLYSIVDSYFKHVNPWCPILDRKSTFEQLLNPPLKSESDRVLLLAIVATALRFSKDPRLTAEARKWYCDTAKRKIVTHGVECRDIQTLKALVILAVHSMGTTDGPQFGNVLALVMRSVVQLALTVERSVSLELPASVSAGPFRSCLLPRPTSWIQAEGRRRIFWVTYILDRYSSVAASADFTLDEQEIDRPLPCSYDLFSKNDPVETRWYRGTSLSDMAVNRPENLGSFSYHCEVVRILSRIQAFLRKPLDIGSISDVEQWHIVYRELDGELNKWLCHVPADYTRISQMCHSDPTSRISNWIMLHAAFVVSVIRLHSCAAYPTVRSHVFISSFNAMQRCLSAVQSLREIAQDVVKTGMLDLLGPHFAFALWLSARLLLVHAAATEMDVDPSIDFFISSLDQMGYAWEIAHSYARTLKAVLLEHQEAKRRTSGPRSPSSPESKTLAAMRR